MPRRGCRQSGGHRQTCTRHQKVKSRQEKKKRKEIEKAKKEEHFLALFENSLWDPEPSIPRAVVAKGFEPAPLTLPAPKVEDFFLDDPPKMPFPVRKRLVGALFW